MKEIILRRINSKKYCVHCREMVKVKMEKLNGYCPFCDARLYSINNKKHEFEKLTNGEQ